MNLVNAVGIMVSFGGVAVLILWLVHKQRKYMRKREKEVMSTISAIQYSQLRGDGHGDNHRYDGLDDAVSEDTDDTICHECNSDTNYKCS
jgi:hypothetical protein